MRRPPIRHSVRQHSRKIKGKKVTVKAHHRGKGKRKRATSRYFTFKKNVTSRSYIYGDFDKDGTPNIDDKRPYDATEKGTIEEILISDELKNIEGYREPFKDTTEEIAKDLERQGYEIKHRVKTPYSIINKLRRKYLGKIEDIGGCLILIESKREAKKAGKYLERKYKILDKDDYYAKPKQGYEALHYTILFEGKPHEIQVKTRKDYKKHLSWHKAYKKGEFKQPS